MMYVLLQIDENSIEYNNLEKQLVEIGVNTFSNYKEGESGVVSLSRVKKYLIDLSEYDDDDIEEEFNSRDL